MPDFWQFPTVSMGLGPICAIYQARFMRYLENRGVIPATGRKVWAFLGDGECDEPESLGALTLASREKLDNLIFVVNCNLQRLDGPVRGNGSIIQELEAAFRGAGWNVVKCIWGSGWDDLLARDTSGLLLKRMHECPDGEYQTFRAHDGAYVRKEFFGKYPELLKLVEHMSDDEIWALRRGGLDPQKVYNAYKRASETKGGPTVVLAKTVKGWGLGESAEGRMTAHQQKKLSEAELLAWDDWTVRRPGGHVYQSRAWATHLERRGWRARHLVIGEAFGVLSMERRWPAIGGGSAYLMRGPIPSDPAPAETGVCDVGRASAGKMPGRGERN